MIEPLNYVAEHEAWNQYALEDGTKLRVRTILTKIVRDGSNEDGTPKYMCSFQQVMDVTPSDLASDRPGPKQGAQT